MDEGGGRRMALVIMIIALWKAFRIPFRFAMWDNKSLVYSVASTRMYRVRTSYFAPSSSSPWEPSSRRVKCPSEELTITGDSVVPKVLSTSWKLIISENGEKASRVNGSIKRLTGLMLHNMTMGSLLPPPGRLLCQLVILFSPVNSVCLICFPIHNPGHSLASVPPARPPVTRPVPIECSLSIEQFLPDACEEYSLNL